MRFEIKNAENTTFKTIIALAFYICALFFAMYIFMNEYQEPEEILNKIINCLCYPVFKEYLFQDSLFYIYNNVYFLLYFAIFYIYEHISIHNNIATRYNTKNWIIHKYIIGIVAIIIISIIQYGCIFYVFKSSMPSSLKYYVYPIIYKTLVMSYVFTLYNIFKTNKGAFIVMSLLAFISLFYFNVIIYIGIIIFTFIFNYLFFDLRLFRYKLKRIKNRR